MPKSWSRHQSQTDKVTHTKVEKNSGGESAFLLVLLALVLALLPCFMLVFFIIPSVLYCFSCHNFSYHSLSTSFCARTRDSAPKSGLIQTIKKVAFNKSAMCSYKATTFIQEKYTKKEKRVRLFGLLVVEAFPLNCLKTAIVSSRLVLVLRLRLKSLKCQGCLQRLSRRQNRFVRTMRSLLLR